ncbi:hypothetical protein [Bartonella sp. TP]|uniref:hypothetical protein n=1 Tax=Bartonella sp. TP TaxID=3057550 RepID=UPI0025B27D7E|nr:hypothetical protein [Bartonella sp. TP]WJW79989.1 hypothetical protein QVL57_05680 [Bartonella sp. TP]
MKKQKCHQGFLWYYGIYKVEVSKVIETGLNEKTIILKIITPYLDRYDETLDIELIKFYKNSRLIGADLWYAPYGVKVPCKIKNYRSFREIFYTMLEHIVSLELLASEMKEI